MVIDIGRGSSVNISGGGSTRSIDASDHWVVETDDMDDVADGGVVELQPGEEKVFLEAEFPEVKYTLMAIGANDVAGVTYELITGGEDGANIKTNSPLGLLNEPISFPDKFGTVAYVEDFVRYKAIYDSDETGTAEVAGRMYIDTS